MSKDEKCPDCGETLHEGQKHSMLYCELRQQVKKVDGLREDKIALLDQVTQLRADKERLQGIVDTEVARAYEHCREIAANRIDEGAGDGWAAACTIIAATICVQKREHFRQAAEAAANEDTAKPQGQGDKSDD